MPFNLLLFPLVGGFYIITRLEYYKYINQRQDRQTIFFNSVLIGIPLLLCSFIICTLFTALFGASIDVVKQYFPIKDQYFGTAVVSFLLALTITWVSNKIINEEEAIATAMKKIGNELERLFLFSITHQQLIQLTLSDHKVYIGWAELLPEPKHSAFVRIIPALSGYRDDKRILHITTRYTDVYSDYIKRGEIKSIDELEMGLVIKVEEILSATRFDIEVFEKFEELAPAESSQ